MRRFGIKLQKIAKKVSKDLGLKFLYAEKFPYDIAWSGLVFELEEKSNIRIIFQFHKYYQGLVYGFAYDKENLEGCKTDRVLRLQNEAEKEFGSGKSSSWWAIQYPFVGYENWNAEVYFDVLSADPENGKLGEFGDLLKEKTAILKTILQKNTL